MELNWLEMPRALPSHASQMRSGQLTESMGLGSTV
ncbi:hypothetical protein HaLaN_09948, partial [Haematococcus lacustris]